jgi:hypothetical protein
MLQEHRPGAIVIEILPGPHNQPQADHLQKKLGLRGCSQKVPEDKAIGQQTVLAF